MKTHKVKTVSVIENMHSVPKAQWKKWGGPQQTLFNELYSHMLHNQGLYLHPRAEQAQPVHWKTTAWNAAFMAACMLGG